MLPGLNEIIVDLVYVDTYLAACTSHFCEHLNRLVYDLNRLVILRILIHVLKLVILKYMLRRVRNQGFETRVCWKGLS